MKQAYTYNLITYNREEVIRKFCETCTKKYAYIYHDKDEKEPHYHIIATFTQRKSLNQIRKMLTECGADQNTLEQETIDLKGSYEYLTHKNQPEKYQYSEESIVTNDKNHFTTTQIQKIDDTEFVEDLIEGKMTYKEMAYKYGRDYIRNFTAYNHFKQQVKMQEASIQAIKTLEQAMQEPCQTVIDLETGEIKDETKA